MSASGIGATVRRKEDHRFLTGKGQYTDDISRPGETRAYFLRSPHAHARIKKLDVKAAEKMPGVVAVLTGEQLAADKIGNLICGWMIHSKDGSPMKMSPHPAIAAGKVCYVGDPVALVVAETLAQAKDAAEKVVVDYETLPAVADPAKAKAGPQIHEIAPKNTIYEWHLGDAQKVDAAFAGAKHVTKIDIVNNRLVPNAMEPRVAIGEYDTGNDSFTLWNTVAKSACRTPRDRGLCRHGAGTQIACDRAGCRRWFRFQDFHLSGRGRVSLGLEAHRPPGEMDVGPLGSVPRRRAWPRSCHACGNGIRRRRENSGVASAKTIANLGAYMSTFSSSVPTYLYATLLSGQYAIPQIYCEVDAVYTNTVPVDAYRGAGRPEATFVVERLVEIGAREWGSIRRICANAIS